MKHFTFLFLIAAIGIFRSGSLQAQALMADTVFHMGYLDAVNGMLATDNGECILVGKMDTDSLTPKNIWVKRMGFQGDTLVTVVWDKFFYPSGSSRVGCVEWTQDGNFIIAGSWNNSNMIMKMNPEGDSLSTLLLPGNSDTFLKDVAELPNGDFVLLQVDVSDDLHARLLRITSDGSLVWEQEFYDRYYSSLEYFNADSLMVSGYEYHNDYQHILYGSFTPEGSELFNEMYQEYYGSNYAMTTDSAAVYLGNQKSYISSSGYVAQVVKMSSTGEVEWEADFTGIGSEVIRDIELYDEYLLTLSEKVTPYLSYVIIGAITYNGVLFSQKMIAKQIPTAIAIETYGNNLYVTGRQSNGANGKDVFFMRYNLDSLFFYISSQQDYAMPDPVRVYPNPSSGMIQVELDDPSGDAISSIRVYNTVGRLEYELNTGNTDPKFQVDLKDLPQGLYLVVIGFENREAITRKVMIVH